MTTLTTRDTAGAGATVKGSPLTNAEVDQNFLNLNSDKLEKSNNLSELTNKATARSNLGVDDAGTALASSLILG